MISNENTLRSEKFSKIGKPLMMLASTVLLAAAINPQPLPPAGIQPVEGKTNLPKSTLYTPLGDSLTGEHEQSYTSYFPGRSALGERMLTRKPNFGRPGYQEIYSEANTVLIQSNQENPDGTFRNSPSLRRHIKPSKLNIVSNQVNGDSKNENLSCTPERIDGVLNRVKEKIIKLRNEVLSPNAWKYAPILCRVFGKEFEDATVIAHFESGFNPQAVSPQGDRGIMQINEPLWGGLFRRKADMFDPEENIEKAKKLYDMSTRANKGDGWKWWMTEPQLGEYKALRDR